MDVNDKTELIYGLTEFNKKSLAKAWAQMQKRMRPEDRNVPFDPDDFGSKLAAQYREMFSGLKASEHLFVTSFAKHRNKDHEQRGIRTLWELYTDNKGYCLQFDEAEIIELLKKERTQRNYAILELGEVRYQFDENDPQTARLLFENEQRLLHEVRLAKPGLGLWPEYNKLMPFAEFAQRMMTYCARHKDPYFEDEREVRILAVPAHEYDLRLLPGTAARKELKLRPDNKRYIELGTDWPGAIEPVRILVGSRASPDLGDVLRLFNRKPEVLTTTFPV